MCVTHYIVCITAMIKLQTRPQTRDEIRRVVDIRCAELGISRSSYAVKQLQITPNALYYLLNGKTRHTAHPEIIAKLNEFTGATMAAWEN